jgi:hypothetical protein
VSASGDPLDLSGEWSGIYNYPIAAAPVSFTASIAESGGLLSGEISEVMEKVPRSAAMEGRRAGLAVTWLKSYEHRDVNHDVQYEGVVSADGQEISGCWSIFDVWSGTFLMARKPRVAARDERRVAAKI